MAQISDFRTTIAKGRNFDATLAKSNPFKDLSLVRPDRCQRRQVNLARSIGTDARRAILEFLEAMDAETGATELPFKVWTDAYQELRPRRSWPALSDKVFSLAMQEAGCRRRMVDGRSKGRGRYVAFTFNGLEAAA